MGLGNVVSNILLVITIVLLISEIYRQQKILKSNCVIQQTTVVAPPGGGDGSASTATTTTYCCPPEILASLRKDMERHHDGYKTAEDKVDSLLHAQQALLLQQVLDKLSPSSSSDATLFEMNRNLIMKDVKEQVQLGLDQSLLYAAAPS